MNNNNNTKALYWAEIIDAYRVIPRILLTFYWGLLLYVSFWFMGLKDPTTAQAAFPSVLTAVLPAVHGLYQSSGRKWDKTGEKV